VKNCIKISLLIALILNMSLLRAQRFFYVDPANQGADFITDNLAKASQYIVKSPEVSDCTVKTGIYFKEPGKTILTITLQDSVTFKTLFEASEEYKYKTMVLNSKLLQNYYFKLFSERYVKQLIFYAEKNNMDALIKLLKEKKDKT
jgi:hypothetical protein